VPLADQKFLFAAFVLHLALPVAAAIAPERGWRKWSGARSQPQSTEIDVDLSQLPADDPPGAQEDDAIGPGRVALHDRMPDVPRPGRMHAPQHDEPEPIANGADDSPDSFPPPEPGPKLDPMSRPPSLYEIGGPLGPGGPGFGTLPPGVLPPDSADRSAAPTRTHKRSYDQDAARKAIDRGVRGKDAQLGLDFPAAAAIAATLRESVRASDAPYDCHGSFSVALNGAGQVTAVHLGGFSGGDSDTWQAIRDSARARLSSRIFEMKSSFAKGAVVGVTVRSEQKMPGGGVSRQGASFSFDVADIGAKPIRVVSVSFSARPLE
jgi:hypothetical protein